MNYRKRIEAQARRLRQLGVEPKRSAIYNQARMSAAVRRAWAEDPAALCALDLGALSGLLRQRQCEADPNMRGYLQARQLQGAK